MHNALKHSGADTVTITFELREQYFDIKIQDNGKGFDFSKVTEFGNGMMNMKKRISEANGVLYFKNNGGTLVFISISLKA